MAIGSFVVAAIFLFVFMKTGADNKPMLFGLLFVASLAN